MSGLGDLDIRPGVGMLAIFPHMNYKPWYALGEFVDNAIQSYLSNKEQLRQAAGPSYRLKVVIKFARQDGGRISVWDNAAGIATRDYRRAFITAEPPPDQTGLSQFGIGMKSASCWFARRFSVRTKALGEGVERVVSFDVPRIVRDGLERLTPVETVAPESEHFTELDLRDLNHMPATKTVDKIKEHLRGMYRVFVRRGELELSFNGEPLEYESPDVLDAPPAWDSSAASISWRKELAFDVDSAHRVHGFAAIRSRASTKDAGFALFRNDRLVQGSDDDAYRPPEIFGASNSFRYQRVFGELHMVGFDVSHTKDVFIWDEIEGRFLEKLRAELDAPPLSILRQAEDFRARTWEGAQKQVKKALDSVAEAVEQAGPVVEHQLQEPAADPLILADPPPSDLPSSLREVDLVVAGEPWQVTLELVNDVSSSQWVELFDTEAGPPGSRATKGVRRIGIRVALSHPFMVRFGGTRAEHLEPLVRVAVGLALAETTSREAGVQFAGAVRARLNDLLRDALAGAGMLTDD